MIRACHVARWGIDVRCCFSAAKSRAPATAAANHFNQLKVSTGRSITLTLTHHLTWLCLTQCRRKPEWAPPPERQPMGSQIFRQFSDGVLSSSSKNAFLVFTLQQIHLYEPLYLSLSNTALLHRQIQTFTTSRAFQGPFTSWWGACAPPPIRFDWARFNVPPNTL